METRFLRNKYKLVQNQKLQEIERQKHLDDVREKYIQTTYDEPSLKSATATQVLKSDSLALVALYNSTNGPNWINKTNWLTGPVSTWHGITVA